MSSVPPLDNLNVAGLEEMPTPDQVKVDVPLPADAAETVTAGRATIQRILDRDDPRLIVVIGPCSIHDPGAAVEYATRLRRLADQVKDTLFLVMRVYFEKPRTSTGWKGFVNDPLMDDSFRIDQGIVRARHLLVEFAKMGLPAGSEALDPLSPQYIGDLISWYTIGARTTESQTHREMASGLSAPVGFKNGTDGSLDTAINAIRSAGRPHGFLGINRFGRPAIIRTRGNRYGHLILRGGGGKPNYDAANVARAETALQAAHLAPNIIVDSSHANSLKDHRRQPLVFRDCVEQIRAGNRSIVGLMAESNLHAGHQSIPADLAQLQYGVSVTDACIDWETTETMLLAAAEALSGRLEGRGTQAVG
ncbi:MAG: 3-deoxy-7-phosphoheptulonate synthase [Acidobacteria bacterium SCN 69-37]|nr:MAG: 3-deoxy-7-phosphoheptulonate synthase [Acidobacteria bacterium SCN 69-37]